MSAVRPRNVAHLIVECLEHEGVEYVFGLPGEENLHMIDALADSSIRFITTRDERGASFMADTYGALTGQPGVCLATLGPGAINLMLGIANAQLDSHPLRRHRGPGRARPDLQGVAPVRRPGLSLPAHHEVGRHGDRARRRPGDGAQGVQAGHHGAAGRHLPDPARRTWRSGSARASRCKVNTPVDTAPDENQVHRAAHVLVGGEASRRARRPRRRARRRHRGARSGSPSG